MMTVVFISNTITSNATDVVQVEKRRSANTVGMRLHRQMFIKMSPRLRAEGDVHSDVVVTNNNIADVGERSHCRCP